MNRSTILAAGLLWLAAAMVTSAQESKGVAVLIYHHFITDEQAGAHPADLNDMVMSASQLRAQLDWLLANHGHPLGEKDVYDYIRGKKTVPPRSFLVTLDDGYESVYKIAWPLLRERGIPCVVAPIVLATDSPESWKKLHPGAIPHLSWDDIHEMLQPVSAGGENRSIVSIESHTYNMHIDNAAAETATPPAGRKAFREKLLADLRTARKKIAEHARGQKAEFLIWPHGGGSAELDLTAAAGGHAGAYWGPEMLVTAHSDPLEIHRLAAGSGQITVDALAAELASAGWGNAPVRPLGFEGLNEAPGGMPAAHKLSGRCPTDW